MRWRFRSSLKERAARSSELSYPLRWRFGTSPKERAARSCEMSYPLDGGRSGCTFDGTGFFYMQDVLLRRDGIDSKIFLTVCFPNPNADFTFFADSRTNSFANSFNGSGDSGIAFACYNTVQWRYNVYPKMRRYL